MENTQSVIVLLSIKLPLNIWKNKFNSVKRYFNNTMRTEKTHLQVIIYYFCDNQHLLIVI